MPTLSKRSLAKLEQADERLQSICMELIKDFDFSVIHTYRTPEEQMNIYKKGRTYRENKWVKTGVTFTNMDGKVKKSYHNYLPSYAMDLYPFPLDLKDIKRFKEMGARVKQIAKDLNIPIEWGGEWKTLKDWGHFQIPKAEW
jgi:peptidoglycan L-alanyl-D-glutamate endopeptidase CwlK